MLRVLRTVRTPHERQEHHDRDNASAPVCSMTQLDIWPSTREYTMMLWRDPHAGGFLHHKNTQRNEIHRTTSDTKRKKSHRAPVEIGTNEQDWLVHVSRRLPKTLPGKLHSYCHHNRNQRCHNSTVRINTESFV